MERTDNKYLEPDLSLVVPEHDDDDAEATNNVSNPKRQRIESVLDTESNGEDMEPEVEGVDSDFSTYQETLAVPGADPGDQSEFISSEFFKIEITNLPTPISFAEARRLVQQKLDLKARKVKLANHPSAPPCIFATFANEEAKQRALKIIDGFEYRQHKLIAKSGKLNRGRDKKQLFEVVEYRPNMSSEELEKFDRIVINSVAPLQTLPYSEQLDFKHKEIIRIMKSMNNAITNINSDLKPKRIGGQLIHKLNLDIQPPLPSTIIDGYRNKNEFTIGRHPNGDPIVGFRVSSFRDGSIHVGSPKNIKTVAEHVQAAVVKFENFLRGQSPRYDVYDPVTGNGHFRTLTVRDCNKNRQLMCMLTISGGILSVEEVEKLGETIKNFYASPKDETVISFYIKVAEIHGQKDKNPLQWIFGERKILLEVESMKFEISPDAFFQVNTKFANVLFEKIVELGDIDSDTSVIDVCCGTGTIGICSIILGNAQEVIGIELVESAIENARRNVELNIINPEIRGKFKYYSGRAEDLVEAAGNTAIGKKIVAIVDPPRSGLASTVVAALRKNHRIQTIVYVACKLEACKENFVAFGRPQSKKYLGAPFIPQRIVPVDMFPHTKDVECIVLFKRYSTK